MTLRTVSELRRVGIEAAASGNHPAATRAFLEALALAPGDAELFSRLALAKASTGDLAAARDWARQGAALAAAPAAALDRMGHVLCRTRDFQEGFALFARAVEAQPTNPVFLRNLAVGAQYVGDLDRAEEAWRAALALSPDDGMAWSGLSKLPGWQATDDDLRTLREAASRPGSIQQRLAMAHSLSAALEQRGDFEGALHVLEPAKQERRRQRPYDFQKDQALFEAARRAFLAGPTGKGADSDAPIFVLGPPRSGTTLMDRILSSHSAVRSAGELGVMIALVRSASGLPPAGPLTASAVSQAATREAGIMAERYLGAARTVIGDAKHFVDKRPFNLILAGTIHRLLPNARIIRMRRHPADTVLGNFRQFFNLNSAHHDYSYDLADAARYVAGLERLSAHWEAVLPANRYRVVDYEELVAEPERVIRETLSYCELAWDPACLSFHRNSDGVSTASAAQVREPLHARNVGLWRRYGSAMAPALDQLRSAGIISDL